MKVIIITIVVLVVVAIILLISIVGEWITAYKSNRSFRQQYKKYKAYVKEIEKARDKENGIL